MSVRYSLLVAVGVVGGHAHHERSSSSTVKEVDAGSDTAAVGGLQASIEVRQEVDVDAVVHARGKDTVDLDVGGVGGPVTDDTSVDEGSQEHVLRSTSVVAEEGIGVVVTDGGVGGSLREGNGRHKGQERSGGELHVYYDYAK